MSSETALKALFANLKKWHTIETLVAFIAGCWLLIEFVSWILFGHNPLRGRWPDIAFSSFPGIFLGTVLRRMFGGPDKKRGRSIAVLPFRNMSADAENEYFSDGLSESIINTLSRIRDFKVVARTSAFSFKGRDVDIREIGRRLTVDHILEGSVQKTGNRLRITAQLINVADGYHVWSERYDRSQDDVFAIQDEISLAILDKLKIKPHEEERKQIIKHHTDDPEAYNLYLKGRYFFNKRTEEGLSRSIQDYQAAIARDQQFALPYAGLADSYLTLGLYHWLPMEEAKAKSEEAALKGLEIDDTIGETHAAHANVLLWLNWQWTRAEEEYRTALQLTPSDVEARHMYAHLLESSARLDEALEEMRKALELEPLSINLNTCLAQILFFSRRADDAIDRLRKTIEMDPGFPLQYFWLGRAYLQKGMLEEAIGAFEKGTQFPAINAIALAGLGHTYAVAGRKGDALRILDQLNRLSKEKRIDPYYVAFLYAGMNEREKALDYLENARSEGDMYLFSLKVDPAFNKFHGDPRFLELMRKTGMIGLPTSQATAPQATLTFSHAKPSSGPGKTIAHYRIIEKIGEGGMGVVYKAEDTKLKRTVALKFLPAEMTRDAQAKARFVQEAQAAAALDHPNICAVYEIGEAEGSTYIAMPYIKGLSLKEKIASVPLSVEEALAIAGQVAEGLKEAHEKGIIHRDIKPANIMLTEKGQAKIMDFGLAKLEVGADLTRTMAVMGTAAYMSPEQARGEEVDPRTDIWSFGATLYEMLTGSAPFGRKQGKAAVYSVLPDMPVLLHSILYDSVELPSRLRNDLPRPVEQIILRALDKDRVGRYQNMAELLKDLKAAATEPAVPKADKSIIVLPFENISPDPDQEYFCDGMTEEIITDLSHVHDLLVISRSSAMTFKGMKKTIPEIARAVNVRYVLEGSIRKAGTDLRITAQLIDASTDTHMWAEKYAGTLDDIFKIQENVSLKIVEALRFKLSPDERHKLTERPLNNPLAYEYYLKARKEILGWTEDSLKRALQYLQNGIDIVGANVVLYAGMGYAYYQLINVGLETDESYLVKAEEYVKKAFELEPGSSYGHLVLGLLKIWWKNAKEGIAHLKKVLISYPDDFDALYWLAWVYAMIGKKETAGPLIDRLMKIDPLNPSVHVLPGVMECWDGKFEAGLRKIRESYQAYPDDFITRVSYTMILLLNQCQNEAWPILGKLAKDMPGYPLVELWLKHRYAQAGERSKVLEWKSPELKKWAWRDWAVSYYVAQCFALIDEKSAAVEWLEHAADLGMVNYPYMAAHDPFLSNLHGEPRFQKLMERVKYEWEHFEV